MPSGVIPHPGCSRPPPVSQPYPSRRVKFLVMGCQGPKAETRWSDPILLRRGTGGTAVPPRVPCTRPDGVPARGTVSALRRHPKTRRGEAVLDLPRPPYPSPFRRTISEPPVSPPMSLIPPPSSRQPQHHRPHTRTPRQRRGRHRLHPRQPGHRAGRGSARRRGVRGLRGDALGVGGRVHGAPWENTPSSAPSAKRWSYRDVLKI